MVNVKEVRLGSSESYYQRKYLYTTAILLCIILSLSLCLICTFLMIFNRIGYNCSHEEVALAEKLINNTTNNLPVGKLNIINRTDWEAMAPTNISSSLITPVPYVIILHTATSECNNKKSCANIVKNIQIGHMNIKKWWDIGYSFLVGGDGNIYVGRGWKQEGAFTYGYNSKAVGIAFIGNFNKHLPPEKSINAAKMLIAMGVENGYIREDYKLCGHRQFVDTLSPGEMLYENMKNWTHWTSKI